MRYPFLPAVAIGLGTISAAQAQFDSSNPIPDPIPKGAVAIELREIATGLTAPNLLTFAGDASGRRFVVDQPGQVHVIDAGGALLAEPFIDLSAAVATLPGRNTLPNPDVPDVLNAGLDPNFDERGLLGLAFHPNFAANGKVYTYHSEASDGAADFSGPPTASGLFDHRSVVSEWTVDPANPDRVDPGSRRTLFSVHQPQFNHNAGMIGFGPDGNMYIPLGDGGGGDDQHSTGGHAPDGNGQTPQNILGSLLRINVDGVGTASANGQYHVPVDNPFSLDPTIPDETFAYGLRNPFRFSFDDRPGGTNRLIVADVGQNDIEEVNIVAAGDNAAWPLKEGSFKFLRDPAGPGTPGDVSDDLTGLPAGLLDPAIEYDHTEGISVIGGFVYRGSAIPELVGKYVFGDFSLGAAPGGRLFIGDLDNGSIEELQIGLGDRALGLFVKGFGQDADGNLYVLAGEDRGPSGDSGQVLLIEPVPEPASLALVALGAVILMTRRQAMRRGVFNLVWPRPQPSTGR